MEYRVLGLSGLRVSAVGLGCMGMSHAFMPSKYETIESGKSIPWAFSYMFSGVRPFCTMNMAMSPTAFDEGVTLIMSPSISFTALYISFTSSNL